MKSAVAIALITEAQRNVPRQSLRGLAKACNCDPSQFVNIKSGRNLPGEELTIRLAEIAGRDPLLCLMEIQAERSKTPAASAIWKRAAERLASVVTSFAIVSLVICAALTPQTASAQALPDQADGSGLYIM